ncbi:MAG: hypothetical protein GF330_11850 [Candidatus Eisenbacteria bacterium]|nr:hypothetical protein [Candidatus Eisenbacteria bacterium]
MRQPPLLLVGLLLTALSSLLSGSDAQPELLASWSGAEDGEQFGIDLAIGGDANGNGRADLAVGASTNDAGGENAGKVSIFFGRATPQATPDLELVGAAGSFFGSAVAWAGDINGDGFDDLLVGAYRDDDAGTNAGKAYIFLGGDPMDDIPDLVLLGEAEGDYFGREVSGAGDLNGDMVADFAIGAPRTLNGTVYVYFGGDPPDGAADLVIPGLAEDDRFGAAIAGVGNADEIPGDDLLVGAPRASTTHLWQGEVYLFSGGDALDALPDWTVRNDDAGAQLGTSVAGAGDVNGDGAADLVAGAPYRNVGIDVDAGAAYLFYGGALLDTSADLVIEGSGAEENLGQSVAGCGDVTANGYGHLLVGAPGFDGMRLDIGKIVLIPGGDPPQQNDFLEFYGEESSDQYGFDVAGGAPGALHSFTGDPHPDIAAGAWGHGIGGKCYLYGLPGGSGHIDDGDPGGSPTPGTAEPGAYAVRLLAQPNPGSRFTLELLPRRTTGRTGALWHQAEDRLAHPDADMRGIEILILAPDGAALRRIPSATLSEGTLGCTWDGSDSHGWPMPSGAYFAVATRDGRLLAGRRLMLIR